MDIITSDSFHAHIHMKDTQTKAQRAAHLYGNYTFDCALPQTWVDDSAEKLSVDQTTIINNFVWLYMPKNNAGQPAPLNLQACDLLARLESIERGG